MVEGFSRILGISLTTLNALAPYVLTCHHGDCLLPHPLDWETRNKEMNA
jgi:hypothetical protein